MLKKSDPQIAKLIVEQKKRQQWTLDLAGLAFGVPIRV